MNRIKGRIELDLNQLTRSEYDIYYASPSFCFLCSAGIAAPKVLSKRHSGPQDIHDSPNHTDLCDCAFTQQITLDTMQCATLSCMRAVVTPFIKHMRKASLCRDVVKGRLAGVSQQRELFSADLIQNLSKLRSLLSGDGGHLKRHCVSQLNSNAPVWC